MTNERVHETTQERRARAYMTGVHENPLTDDSTLLNVADKCILFQRACVYGI